MAAKPFLLGLGIGLVVALIVGAASWMTGNNDKKELAAEVEGIEEAATAVAGAASFSDVNELVCAERKGDPEVLAEIDRYASGLWEVRDYEEVSVDKLHFINGDHDRIRFEDDEFPTVFEKIDGSWQLCDPYVDLQEASDAYTEERDRSSAMLDDSAALEGLEGIGDIDEQFLEEWEKNFQELLDQAGQN
ncbi:hypothetical protein [Corynebacterium ciconiae]|nr:hypothetical protein [Corynebacterium ciconiae]